MDTTSAFARLRRNFLKARAQMWGAILGSLGAAALYAGLLLLLGLFADQMVWKGSVPDYASLPPAQKVAFSEKWENRSEADRAEALGRLGFPDAEVKRLTGTSVAKGPPTRAEWEAFWRAEVLLTLQERVGASAAEAYADGIRRGEAEGVSPHLGLAGLVIRERDRWFGRVLGWIASWNPWTWWPGSSDIPNPAYLAGLFILAFGLSLFRGLLLNGTAYLAAAVTLDTVTRLRRAIYFHTFRLGSLAVRSAGIAEPVDLFTRRVEAIGEAVHAWLAITYRYPAQFVLMLILVLAAHFWLGISFLLLSLLVWVVTGQVAAYFQMEGRLAGKQAAALLTQLKESMSIMRLVKCYQMERFNQNRVERQLAESARSNWRRWRGEALSRPLLLAAASLAAVSLLYLAGRAVLAGEFGVPGLIVMATAIASMFRPIEAWLESRRSLRIGREASAAVFEFLDRKGETAEAADAEFLPALTTRIEFRQVTLRESGTGRPLLENINFAIPAGSRVAFVGPDDHEKRTLLYLIPRFLDPTNGEIRIEDKNIRWVTHESLRAQVGIVLQDDLIFGDSVLNNIGTGDPSYSMPQIIEAAKLAHAHQFIERLPYGYETLIGDLGHSLRPGERFRIALARALLRDPSILIIEEPSGPVDEDTLALLDDTLDRVAAGRTILFLAHRVSTLRTADRIFLLRGGHLEASGNHRDLWHENESYRRLPMLADIGADAVT